MMSSIEAATMFRQKWCIPTGLTADRTPSASGPAVQQRESQRLIEVERLVEVGDRECDVIQGLGP